jgi:PTS system mannose-specific IIA component
MSVGVLVLAHAESGASLIAAAKAIVGDDSLAIDNVAVHPDDDAEVLVMQARTLVDKLDQGAGILIVTDLFGSTPCNIARQLGAGRHIRIVAGLNLAMLLRILNYPGAELGELVDKALAGGRQAIMDCSPTRDR